MLTIVFDLDGTLIDTAPDLIDALNFTLAGHALPTVPYARARSLIGGGALGMSERALILEGRKCRDGGRRHPVRVICGPLWRTYRRPVAALSRA